MTAFAELRANYDKEIDAACRSVGVAYIFISTIEQQLVQDRAAIHYGSFTTQ